VVLFFSPLTLASLVQEPDFDTQSKECLTSISETWGSAPVMPKDVMKRIEETSLVEDLVEMLRVRDAANIGTKIKAKRGVLAIAKLDDANFAGSGESCQLILTEGDSAKALAVSGLSVVGRDRYGVFPLRGKVMNVRDVSSKVRPSEAFMLRRAGIWGRANAPTNKV